MQICKYNQKPLTFNGKPVTAPSWTPFRVSTVAWWDMSESGLITESGGLVSQVNDKSGNDRHLLQTNGAYQPATGTRTINGKNVVEFDTTNWLEHTNEADLIFPISEKTTVFAIASRDVSNAQDMYFYVKDGPAGVVADTPIYDGLGSGENDVLEAVMMFDDFSNRCRTTYQDAPDWFTESGPTSQYGAASPGNTPIHAVQFHRGKSGTRTLYQWVNGEVDSTSIFIQNANVASTVVLGGHGSLGSTSRRLDGVIGEIVVLTGEITDSIRYKMEGYLAWKWGLVSQLPFNHPYKYTEPS